MVAEGKTISQLDELSSSAESDLSGYSVAAHKPGFPSKRIDIHRLARGYVLRASGIGTIDQPALEAACAANPVVVIDDSFAALRLDQGGDIECGDVVICSEGGKRAHISLRNETRILFGEYLSPGSSDAWVSGSVSADNSQITAAGLSDVEIGDVIVITSDNAIDGAEPHTQGGETRPAELVRVEAVNGSTFNIESQLVDTYTSNVRVYHLKGDGSQASTSNKSAAVRAGLVNIDFTGSNNGSAVNQVGVLFLTCIRPVVENVVIRDCGSINFNTCLQGYISQLRCDGQINGHRQYGIALSACDEFFITGFVSRDCRHHITTGGFADQTDSDIRVATNRNNVVTNSVGTSTGNSSPNLDSNIGWDTHSESYGMTFINVIAKLTGNVSSVAGGSGPSAIGFSSRGRASKYIDCIVEGGDPAKKNRGFLIYADDTQIINPTITNCWIGIRIAALSLGRRVPNRCTVKGGTIRNCRNEGIYCDGGDGHDFDGVKITACGSASNGEAGSTGSAITLAKYYSNNVDCTNVKIRNCTLPKGPGFSIHTGTVDIDELEIYGNTFEGYDRASIGLDRSLASTPSIEERFTSKNNRPDYIYAHRDEHGLTTSEVGYPIDETGSIWDNSASFAGILVDVINEDHVVLAQPGKTISIPYAMVNGVVSYNPATDGYKLRWKSSSDGYSVTGNGIEEPAILRTLRYSTDGLEALIAGQTESSAAANANAVGIDDLGTQSGNYEIDFASGSYPNKKIELSGDITFTFANAMPGKLYVVSIKTNGNTVTWPSNLSFFDGAPTFSSGSLYQPVQIYHQG